MNHGTEFSRLPPICPASHSSPAHSVHTQLPQKLLGAEAESWSKYEDIWRGQTFDPPHQHVLVSTQEHFLKACGSFGILIWTSTAHTASYLPVCVFPSWLRPMDRKTKLSFCSFLPGSLMRLCFVNLHSYKWPPFFFLIYTAFGFTAVWLWHWGSFLQALSKGNPFDQRVPPSDFIFYHSPVRSGLWVESCSYFI